jgi:hypothetical protein
MRNTFSEFIFPTKLVSGICVNGLQFFVYCFDVLQLPIYPAQIQKMGQKEKKRKENCVASVCIYCGFYCEAYLSEMKRMDAR